MSVIFYGFLPEVLYIRVRRGPAGQLRFIYYRVAVFPEFYSVIAFTATFRPYFDLFVTLFVGAVRR